MSSFIFPLVKHRELVSPVHKIARQYGHSFFGFPKQFRRGSKKCSLTIWRQINIVYDDHHLYND